MARSIESSELCEGHDPGDEVEATALSRASFIQGATGPVLVSVVAQYSSTRVAEEFLDAVTAVVNECASYHDASGAYQLEPVDLDGIGEEAVAARLTGDGAAGPVEGRVLYVRVRGRVTAAISVGPGGAFDADVALAALRVVVERIS